MTIQTLSQQLLLYHMQWVNLYMETWQSIVKEGEQCTLSKPDIAEKSKGFGGIAAPGAGEDVLCPDCGCSEDASVAELLGSWAPVLKRRITI